MKCQNCDKDHDGTFATGRFCNRSCSNSFSTKRKRNEINEKVSKTLTGKYLKLERIEKECPICETVFIHLYNKTCCNSCKIELNRKKQLNKKKKSGNERKKGSGGLRDGGGRSKSLEYESSIAGKIKLNKEEIRVAKILDLLKMEWKRNSIGFAYKTKEGLDRKYHPDFYITDLDYYIEFKGWVTNDMNHKMKEAKIINNFKLLIIYSDSKRYGNLGLNIKQLEENPLLLYKHLKEN